MGKGGGGSSTPSGNTTTTQTNTPWSGQQPFLNSNGAGPNQWTQNPPTGGSIPGVMPQAASLYQNYSPQYFPTSTVSPFNDTQNAGLGMEAAYGLGGGASSVGASNSALTNIGNGAFLNPNNPWLGATAQSVAQSVLPQVDSQFAGANRFGSGANVNADTSAVANAVAPLAFQNYGQAMQNQVQAAAAAPFLQSAQESSIQDVLNSGSAQQQQAQAQLNDQVNRWNFQQQLPYNQLATYQQMVNGNYGGTGTLTQPYFAQSGKGAGQTIAQVAPIAAKAAMTAFA